MIKEFSLILCCIFVMLWLYDSHLAILMTAIFVPILLSALVIAIIAEKLDKSKISNKYFSYMFVASIIPIVVMFFMHYVLKF